MTMAGLRGLVLLFAVCKAFGAHVDGVLKLDLSDGASSNSSFDLSQGVGSQHSMNLADLANSLDSFGLVSRQLRCTDPTKFLCPDQSGCCAVGQTCTGGGCCFAGRQPCGASGCYSPASEKCCSSTSTSCPISKDCVTGGCCASGKIICSTVGCYTPSTETCCSDGSTCPKNYDCYADRLCCPTGSKPCGSSRKCYDPTKAKCCSDGKACPNGYDCTPGAYCCPTGTIPCGSTGKCYNPLTDNCCNTGGQIWLCSLPAKCCSNVGVCYGPGEQCCQGGSCPSADTCCGKECCRPGAYCGSDGYCSRSAGVTLTRPATATPSQTRATSAPPTQTPDEPETQDPPDQPSTSAAPAPTTATTAPITATTSNACQTPSAAPQNAAALPVLEFVYIEGVQDDVIYSMCLGMRARGKVNEDVLTYAGDGASCKRRRRRSTGCSACCRGVRKGPGPYQGEATQCDEYPFASTAEGGAGSHISCIVGWQNTMQGIYFNSWLADVNLQAGQQFRVRISNYDCSRASESLLQSCLRSGKRQNADDLNPMGSTTKIRALSPATNSSVSNITSPSFLAIALTDLSPGTYSSRAHLTTGTLSRLAVYDGDGNVLATADTGAPALRSEGSDLQYSIEADDIVGASVVGFTSDTAVVMEYRIAAVNQPIGGSGTLVTIPGATTTGVAGRPSVGWVTVGFAVLWSIWLLYGAS